MLQLSLSTLTILNSIPGYNMHYTVEFDVTTDNFSDVHNWLKHNLGPGLLLDNEPIGRWTAKRVGGAAQGWQGPWAFIFKHESDAIWFSLTWL